MLAALLYICITPASAWEIDIPLNTVTTIGVHDKNVGFVSFKEGVHQNCAYQHLYFDISTSTGKSYLSILSTAKVSKTKVRIGYTAPASQGQCYLELAALVEVE